MSGVTITFDVSEIELREYLHLIDNEYIPPISSLVELDDYILKLSEKATKIAAICNDRIVGLSAFYINNDERQAYITTIGVLKTHTKQGIASRLLELTISDSFNKGIEIISLEVFVENVAAIHFYSKFGFIKTDEYLKNDKYNNSSKWIRMSLSLNNITT